MLTPTPYSGKTEGEMSLIEKMFKNQDEVFELKFVRTPEAKKQIFKLNKEYRAMKAELKEQETAFGLEMKSRLIRKIVAEIAMVVREMDPKAYKTEEGLPILCSDIYRELGTISSQAKNWEAHYKNLKNKMVTRLNEVIAGYTDGPMWHPDVSFTLTIRQ